MPLPSTFSTGLPPGMTPEEAFLGRKPSVSHLCVFGCVAYVHIPKPKRRSLDAKSSPMIFTGYVTHSKGFHFWDPKKKDIVLSRDAKFDEFLFEIQGVSSPSSSSSQDPFPSLELEPLLMQSSSSISAPVPPSPPSPIPIPIPSPSIPLPTKDPPKWVRSLIKDSGISLSKAQSSTSRVLRNHGSVNFALMSHLQDVFEPDSVEEALALPQWHDAMQDEP